MVNSSVGAWRSAHGRLVSVRMAPPSPSHHSFQTQPRLQRPSLPRSVVHSKRGLVSLFLRPTLADMFDGSFVFPAPPAAVSEQRFSAQLVCTDNKDAVRLWIRYVNYTHTAQIRFVQSRPLN